MSTRGTALSTAVRCTRPADSGTPRCDGCGLTARAMVFRVSRRAPPPRWRAGWTQREVWSALATAEADLETVWLLPGGRSFRQARFCGRCAPAGPVWIPDCAGCGMGGGGPIVVLGADTLPGMPADDRARERAITYLRRLGWLIGPVSCCPCCRGIGREATT